MCAMLDLLQLESIVHIENDSRVNAPSYTGKHV